MKKLWKIIAVMLVLSMILAGCSKKSEAPSVESSTVTAESKRTGGSYSGTASGDSGATDATSNATEIAVLPETKPSEDVAVIGREDVAVIADADEAWDAPEAYGEAVSEEDGSDYTMDMAKTAVSASFAMSDALGSEPMAMMPIEEPIIIDDPIVPEPVIDEPVIIEPTIAPVMPRAGLLTAGEWNDNRNFDFLKNLLKDGQTQDWSGFFKDWGLTPFTRTVFHVSDASGSAVVNAAVDVYDASGSVIWQGRTDYDGMCYAYCNLLETSNIPARAEVAFNGVSASCELTSEALIDGNVVEITLDATRVSKKLDLMLVVDTTGSMGDEIKYLQTELDDVVSRVAHDNANLPIRLSVNFYRDLEDDYVVKSFPFSYNIDEQMGYLRVEYADGGGDYEEAVEMALSDAVNNHEWDEDSIKIMFMVLDAPPHMNESVKSSLYDSIQSASEKGIRIIPVASSGVDKSTEFLLRTLAMTTGGTYTFLTNDSGIGGDHIEPTIGHYEVEQLNDLMVRVINQYLQ